MGRKSLFTEETQEIFLNAARNGANNDDACVLSGISRDTFYNWQRDNDAKGNGSKYFDFFNALKKARSARKGTLEQLIFKLGTEPQDAMEVEERYNGDGELIEKKVKRKRVPPQWQAIAWILERRYPDEYGRRERIDMNSNNQHQHNHAGEVTVKQQREMLKALSTEDLEKLEEMQRIIALHEKELQEATIQ